MYWDFHQHNVKGLQFLTRRSPRHPEQHLTDLDYDLATVSELVLKDAESLLHTLELNISPNSRAILQRKQDGIYLYKSFIFNITVRGEQQLS